VLGYNVLVFQRAPADSNRQWACRQRDGFQVTVWSGAQWVLVHNDIQELIERPSVPECDADIMTAWTWLRWWWPASRTVLSLHAGWRRGGKPSMH